MHDLLIENASLIDGSGAPARPGSVAVSEGRIVAIGDDLGPARERIDADGLTLAPGIIDLHTHFDAQLLWDPFATPSVRLGVTSVVIGNCGFTIAPCHERDRDRILRNLTHVEGMSLDALRAGVDWSFESYPQYLSALERSGHGAQRRFVHRPLLGAHLCAGRGCFRPRRDARGSRADEAHRAGRAACRCRRLLHHHAGAAQRRKRHSDALASRRRARADRAHLRRSARPATACSCSPRA